MKANELGSQPWQYIGTVGIVRDQPGVPALYVAGINGGNDHCVGLTINGNTVERLPNETWDDLVARVRRNSVVRGDPSNIATAVYPNVEPKPVRQLQPRFEQRNSRW